MPSEWFATAVTGAVGVVGIVGTFATSWHQQRVQARLAEDARAHQVKDAVRGERKLAYGKYLDISGELIDKYQELLMTPAGHSSRPVILKESRDIAATLRSAETEVDIVGNPLIAKEMAEFRMSVLKLQLAAMRPDFADEPAPKAAIMEMVERLSDSRLDLTSAIRRDLAISPPVAKGRMGIGSVFRRSRRALGD